MCHLLPAYKVLVFCYLIDSNRDTLRQLSDAVTCNERYNVNVHIFLWHQHYGNTVNSS